MESLFDSSEFVLRDKCGPWSMMMQFGYRIGSMLAFFGYLAIALTILYLWLQKRKQLPKPFVLFVFSCVFFFCAACHAFDWLAFVWPAYRLNAIIVGINGVLSIVGAVLLPFLVSYVINSPTPLQLQEAVKAKDEALAKAEKHSSELIETLTEVQRFNQFLQKQCEEMGDVVGLLRNKQVTEEEYQKLVARLRVLRTAREDRKRAKEQQKECSQE